MGQKNTNRLLDSLKVGGSSHCGEELANSPNGSISGCLGRGCWVGALGVDNGWVPWEGTLGGCLGWGTMGGSLGWRHWVGALGEDDRWVPWVGTMVGGLGWE